MMLHSESSVPAPRTSGPSADEAPPAGRGGGTSRFVLVVEGDDALRHILLRVVARAGYDVAGATAAAEALEELRGRPAVDALLADVALSDMDGIALARHVRAAHPGVRVLLMGGPEKVARVEREALAHVIVRKPFTLRELTASLRAAFHGAVNPGTGAPL